MPSQPFKAASRSIGHSLKSRDLIRCVVVLEDREVMRERLAAMLKDSEWIVITTDNWAECIEWARRHVRIFVLDIVLPDEPAGGLKALEGVKHVASEAFCALVTEDLDRVRNIAKNLGADHLCGKSEEELENLLRTLDHLESPLSDRERAKKIMDRIVELGTEIDCLLAAGMISGAEHALVRLEGPLSEAVRLSGLGEDFATAVDALHFALINAPGSGLSTQRWKVWTDVANETFASFPISITKAIELAKHLSDAGWVTEPPNFRELSDFLLSSDAGGGRHAE